VVLRNNHTSAIRIEEHLGGIKTNPVRRVPGTVHAITVNLIRSQAGREDVPIVVRTVRRGVNRNYPARARIVLSVKEQQLHGGRSTREYAEIDAVREDRCSQRIAPPRALIT